MSPFLIAEMGASHNGSLETALDIVRAAAMAGADAVKLQTFDPDEMVGDPNFYLAEGPWRGESLLHLYRRAHTPRSWHPTLFDEIRHHGMVPMSTPFSPADVEFLEDIGCERYKIASFEIGHTELLRAVAETGKDLFVSTGMARDDQIQLAVDLVRGWHWGGSLTLLKCTSAYPAPASAANLATMPDMAARWNVPVGLSDHSRGVGVACLAVALGATVVERHITTSYGHGLDDGFASSPGEWARFATAVRETAQAMGEVRYGPTEAERASTALVRSLWWAEDLPAGTRVERQHLKVARPAGGRPPGDLEYVLGQVLETDVTAGTPVT